MASPHKVNNLEADQGPPKVRAPYMYTRNEVISSFPLQKLGNSAASEIETPSADLIPPSDKPTKPNRRREEA